MEVLLEPGEGYLSDTGGPIYTELTELLGVTVKVALLGGLVLALPILTYQVIAFVSPGLTRREKTYLISMTPAALLCFAAGSGLRLLRADPTHAEVPAHLCQRCRGAHDPHQQLRKPPRHAGILDGGDL